MSIYDVPRALARELFQSPPGEADPGFHPILERHIERGMWVAAGLGISGATFFVVANVMVGNRPVWIQDVPGAAAVALADKVFIVALCLLILAAARWMNLRRWGRAVLGSAMVVIGLAIALDDFTRGDNSFTVGWLVLVQLVAVGTVPFTAREALAVCAGMVGVYIAVLSLRPGDVDVALHEGRLAYFIFASIIMVTLTAYLYRARYGQYRARRQAEELRDRLAERSDELETSLAELAATQDELVRAERFAALGQVTSGVAHEIQNPLNFVINFASLNEELVAEVRDGVAARQAGEHDGDDLDDVLDDLARNASSIHAHGRKAARIVSRMLEHASATPGELGVVDLNAFVEEQVGVACRLVADRGGAPVPEVIRDYADDVPAVQVRSREMGAALLNVLDNALRAAVEQDAAPPVVRVSTRRVDGGMEIRVVDNGPGIPEAARERLFEPFFTTRPTGEGTGLGLSMAHDAVTHGHGGTLVLDSSPDGTVCTIGLPASGAEPPRDDLGGAVPEAVSRRGRAGAA